MWFLLWEKGWGRQEGGAETCSCFLFGESRGCLMLEWRGRGFSIGGGGGGVLQQSEQVGSRVYLVVDRTSFHTSFTKTIVKGLEDRDDPYP